jgi:hypothetical protein
MRWNDTQNGWEVFIPAASFKNSTSSFLGGGPFQLILPDLSNLYQIIDEHISTTGRFFLVMAQI